jgi:predicted membrane metal-binding protein
MSFHETTLRDAPAKTSSDRSFGLVFAAVFAIVTIWPLIHGEDIRWWSLAIAAAFLVIALAIPRILHPLNRAWTAFGLLLHRIVSPVIMGAIFFVAVTPIALLMRLFGKIPLQLRFDPKAASYWIVRTPPGPAGDTMKNQF